MMKAKSMMQQSKINVTIHAIPVIDGKLISSEHELMGSLGDKDMRVDLINDFEVAWLDYSKPYPKYQKTIKLMKDDERSDDDDIG